MIAEQRSLIEDLAHSNQEYINNFENLRLGIGGDTIEGAETIPKAGAVETEWSTKTKPIPPAPVRKFDSMNFATLKTPQQDEENTRGLGFNESTTATRLSPNARSGMTKLLATPPNADINDLFINASGRSNIAMPPLQVQGKSTTKAPLGSDQEVLFKQLKDISMLVQDLLKEVDAPQYKITSQSRLRMKGGIAGLRDGERRELEKMWGCTALQKAEQRLDSLVEGFGDSPTMRRSVPSNFSANESLFGFDTHRDDSFAGSPDKWPSLFLTTDPPLKQCMVKTHKKGAKVDGCAKNITDSIEQSTDAPVVGYVPFQSSTSATTVDFYSGFDSLEAGVDVRTPINVYSSLLMQFNRNTTPYHSTAISTI